MSIKYGKPYVLRRKAHQHPPGTVCYRSTKYDYGCASDDTRATGVEHVSMTLDETGDYPFFTVPVQDLTEAEA